MSHSAGDEPRTTPSPGQAPADATAETATFDVSPYETSVREAGADEAAAPGATAARPSEARMPGRAAPVTLIVVGALALLLSPLVWFAMSMFSALSGGVDDSFAAFDTGNGEPVLLPADTSYAIALMPADEAFYTNATEDQLLALGAPSCTATGPDGEVAVEVSDAAAVGPEGGSVQETWLTTGTEGEYTVQCDVDPAIGEARLSLYPAIDDAALGGTGVLPLVVAAIVALAGLASLVVGIIWLLRVNRRRRELRVLPGQDDIGGTRAGRADALGLAGREPAPSSDERVVLSPENAFGYRSGSGKPVSMVPAVLTIVLGAVLMLGGPIGGVLTPVIGFFADPTGSASGGTATNGGSVDLPASSSIGLYFAESPESMPTTDEGWATYTPPPTPECQVTDPDGAPVEIVVETTGSGADSFESASMTSTSSGSYTFTCDMDSRYAGTIDAYSMGPAEGADTGLGAMGIGLIIGAIGLVVLIVGIVMAVRASGRRHDMGA